MFQEVDQFRPTSKHLDLPDDLVEMDRNRRKEKIQSSRRASGSLREIDKDIWKFERSGSDVSPMKGKNCFDQNLENGEFRNLAEHAKDSGFRDVQENERLEAGHNDERQPRKRKRNIMNEKQTALIERALLDEPEMQRNASSLQSWADKLSVHGSELTSSQLKNWLNNRKAKLARVAREAHAPSEDVKFWDFWQRRECCRNGRGGRIQRISQEPVRNMPGAIDLQWPRMVWEKPRGSRNLCCGCYRAKGREVVEGPASSGSCRDHIRRS